MISELSGYAAQLDRVNAEVRTLTGGLSDEQFNWRPERGRWSIGENVAHLTAMARAYLPALDEAITYGQARSLYGEGPFRYGLIERVVAWSMEPPVRFRLRTARPLVPQAEQQLRTTLPAFFAVQSELRQRVDRANGLDLSRVKVRSPFARMLSMSFGKMLGTLLAHERRHLWHARQVRDSAGFPIGRG
jgi:hypothetical protein